MTPEEIDQVVRLWNQRREAMDRHEEMPTVQEVAEGLNIPAPELAALLIDVRRKGLPAKKKKPFIPAKMTWLPISLVYVTGLALAVLFYRTVTRPQYIESYTPVYEMAYTPGEAAMAPPAPGFVSRASSVRLPHGFSAEFGGQNAVSDRRVGPSKTDWDGLSSQLQRFVLETGHNREVPLSGTVTHEEIAQALESVGNQSRLFRWSTLRVSSKGPAVTIQLPIALVADVEVETAVKAAVKERITKLVEALKARTDLDAATSNIITFR